MGDYRAKIICFSCKFSWGYLIDEAILSREIENWIPLICTGKIDATQIMDAFKAGADGVLILGCPEGDCHYQDGNFEARKKVYLLRKLLKSWGIEEKRLRIVLSANPDGRTIPQLLQEMSRDLTKLGPLKKVKMAGGVREEENVVRRGK